MSTITDTRSLALSMRIEVARVGAGLDQRQLADAIGVARTTVSGWERGISEPPLGCAVRLAQATGVTLDWLAEWFRAQGWAQESKRSRTTSYRLFWKWAKRNLGIPNAAKMLPRVKPAEPTPRPTPDRVYMKALMRSDRRTRLILRLAAEAGLRRGEIALVNTETDLIEDMVGWSLIVHGKGGKIR